MGDLKQVRVILINFDRLVFILRFYKMGCKNDNDHSQFHPCIKMSESPAKKKRYESKYRDTWKAGMPWVSKSDRGENHAYCTLCNCHINVSHGGKNDVIKHSKTSQHEKMIGVQKTTPSVKSFFFNSNDDSAQVTKAEVLFANFIGEHNISFSVADHFTKLCKVMFPDSAIAKKFACGRMKTTMIVKHAIAPVLTAPVVKKCQNEPFSLLIDESNDYGSDKQLVILVRLADGTIGKSITRFLDIPICNIGTAESIFTTLDSSLRHHNIPWSNLVSFTSDNCSVMVGKNNSVLSRIKEVQPAVFDMGCISHLANLCCVAAVKTLPLPVEDLLSDIYSHFNKSSKRKEQYREFLEFTDTEELKILKHASTRWLSLEKCVRRTLHQWPALQSYFSSHEDVEKPGKVKNTAEHLENPEMKLYFQFLQFILSPLNEFNTTFQSDEALVGLMSSEITRLLRKFLGKFVKSAVIRQEEDITKVDYANDKNQLPDEYLAVGMTARESLEDLEKEKKNKYFRSVRTFYCTIVKKMIKKFPFHDPLLNDLKVLNPSIEIKDELNNLSVMRLAKRFSLVEPHNLDKLEEEFIDYKTANDLPSFNKEKDKIDEFWGKVFKLKSKIGAERFPYLSKVLKAALTMPNSNADSERVFSMCRKIHTCFRSELKNDTLKALLSCKINKICDCFNFQPDRKLCDKAKTSTWDYVQEHS